MVGRTLGHYRVIEQIGAGGMGVVFRARDERLERDVALKVLPAGSLGEEAARGRFRKEALALARLNHPHIGAVYDFDSQDGVDFLVMEYVEGTTLASRLLDGRPSEREVVAIGAQIADALQDAHERGVVHRDLKPGNIIVNSKGQAKVLDFGLARLLDPAADLTGGLTLTETRHAVGTPPYMAPEQLRGQPADSRTDVHALGAVLYEMATGRRAFHEEQPPLLIDAILNRAPAPPQSLNPRMSPALERIVIKCLEKEPARRYQSASEVVTDLERLTSEPTGASRQGRAAWRLAAVAGVVAVLAAVAYVFDLGGLRERLPGPPADQAIESLAVLPLDNLSGKPDQEYFADGMTDALINELSRISALKVISRTSVMPYKGARKPLRQIASELGVDGVIEGSVLREGDQVRISVQLIHGATDRNVWSDSYQREVRSVLALQADVARAVAREIKVTLTPQDETRLAAAIDVNREAYDAYLKGLQLASLQTDEGQRKAIESLETAVRLDSGYAQAHARLAYLYATFYMGGGLAPHEFFPKAKAAALRAIELDNTDSDAYVALANTALYYDRNWPEAAGYYEKAIALNPSNAAAHTSYASYLHSLGRFDEAFAQRMLARTLNPLSAFRAADSGYPLYFAGRHDEAVRLFRTSLDMDPRFFWGHLWTGQVLIRQGEYARAIVEIERAAEMSGRNTRVIATLGNAYGLAGRAADARAILAELRSRASREYVSAYYVALVYAGLGMRDQVFEELDKAIEERQPYVVLLNVEPPFLALHSDARFQGVLRRVGIPTAAR